VRCSALVTHVDVCFSAVMSVVGWLCSCCWWTVIQQPVCRNHISGHSSWMFVMQCITTTKYEHRHTDWLSGHFPSDPGL